MGRFIRRFCTPNTERRPVVTDFGSGRSNRSSPSCIGAFANCHDLLEACDISLLSCRAGSISSGSTSTFSLLPPAQGCGLLENVRADGVPNKVSEPMARLLASRPIFACAVRASSQSVDVLQICPPGPLILVERAGEKEFAQYRALLSSRSPLEGSHAL